MQNELIHSQSPYLLQHATNPVWWKMWREEHIQHAIESNKLLIVSIGYSACHWCHVMEHECFEDETVAAVMNQHYISIKVDREERPDLDQIYMDACQIVSGRGGWPLNAVCLPDGRPVFAGTYFPRPNWIRILQMIQEEFETQPYKLEERAEHILKGIRMMDDFGNMLPNNVKINHSDLNNILEKSLEQIDPVHGGMKGAPKFAMPVIFKNFLPFFTRNKQVKTFEAVENLVYHVIHRGCYDHIEGGFMRYAVDAQWQIPHFEKMLYDNAQLLELIALLYRIHPQPSYRWVVKQTISFITRDWQHPEGGIYAAYDADSDGHEGKYYVCTPDEIKTIQQETQGALKKFFYLPEEGNFEGNYHLLRERSLEEIQADEQQSFDKILSDYEQLINRIYVLRSHKNKPGLDHKIITAWNALLVKSLVTCYISFKEPDYLKLAKDIAQFLINARIHSDGSVMRTATQKGFLDDAVFMMEALLALYKVTSDESYLNQIQLMETFVDQHFSSSRDPLYYYTSDTDPALIVRKKEVYDQVIPSSNSALAGLKIELGLIHGQPDKIESGKQMALYLYERMQRNPIYFANWWNVLYASLQEPVQIVVCGPEALVWAHSLQFKHQADVQILPATQPSSLSCFEDRYQEGKTLAYCCKDKICSQPVDSMEALEKLLSSLGI